MDRLNSTGFFVLNVVSTQLIQYQVLETIDLFAPANHTLLSAAFPLIGESRQRPLRAFVVIDEVVNKLWGAKACSWFAHQGVEALFLPLEICEDVKSFETVLYISRAIDDFGLNRRSEPIIGIGGGVLLDIVGLVASIYRRGVPYIRVPTSMMGMIDAGIGVKTGVNLDMHKNRLGSYYAPIAAVLDRNFLHTLDDRHLSNGMAEILKLSLVTDRHLFELMEVNGTSLVSGKLQAHEGHHEIFKRALQGMLSELQPNLWEERLARRVDYGHSISPFLEMRALPELLHGEAVCIDMVFCLLIARGRGLLSAGEVERVLGLIRLLKLPVFHDLMTATFVQEALQETIRHRDGRLRLPLSKGLGSCVFVDELSPAEITHAVEEQRRLDISP
jgi:3-dehydroquinate synthetase